MDVTKHTNIMKYQGSFITFAVTIKDENKCNLAQDHSTWGVKEVSANTHTHTNFQTQKNFQKIYYKRIHLRSFPSFKPSFKASVV